MVQKLLLDEFEFDIQRVFLQYISSQLLQSEFNKEGDGMSTFLCIVLFVAFALAQLLCAKNATHKVIRYIPILISAVCCVFAVGLHIYALIIYSMGVVSESVLAENQYFASFILIPAGICLIGAVAGFLIGKKVKFIAH